MANEKSAAYEFQHIKCDTDDVQAIINHLQKFFWEVTGTNTVVSKESHLESGGIFDSNSIYSVWSEERFSTIDFKRDKNNSNYTQIKEAESQYVNVVGQLERLGCSAADNYSSPPPMDFNILKYIYLLMLWILPGRQYKRKKEEEHAIKCSQWKSLKAQYDSIFDKYKSVLNL
jgi:hypothetical protein